LGYYHQVFDGEEVMEDALGDRMKEYEGRESNRTLIPLLPAMARLDGRAFHSFTKGMDRPYDDRMISLMVETTKSLVAETNAVCGYTQSDEISLAWLSKDYKNQIFFDGRIMKMTSILASLATLYFNTSIKHHFDDPMLYEEQYPVFDCRVWNVPNIEEGANVFLWREKDATRNSIQMAAQNQYSHKQLMNKNCSELQEMLFQKGINWNDYPDRFKRGTYIQRKKVKRKFFCDELEKLPKNHDVFKNPELEVERTDYVQLELPPLGRVINRAEVLFYGAEPITVGENGNEKV